jgi:hypothetical protein
MAVGSEQATLEILSTPTQLADCFQFPIHGDFMLELEKTCTSCAVLILLILSELNCVDHGKSIKITITTSDAKGNKGP